MKSFDYNVDRLAKWLRNIAMVIISISGIFWLLYGLVSGLSKKFGLGGILFEMSPGFLFLFVAAIAWQWGIIGGTILIMLGIIVFFLYISMIELNLLVFIYASPSGLPPIIAGCLFLISWCRARRKRLRQMESNKGLKW
jgi:hypothetical protein